MSKKKKIFDNKFFEMILEAFSNKNNEFIIITLIQIKNRLNNEKIWTLKLQSYEYLGYPMYGQLIMHSKFHGLWTI